MNMKLSKTVEFTDQQVRHAIEILISECFTAMCFANALGGHLTPEWEIIHNFSVEQIFEDAKQRGLPLRDFKAAVGGRPILETWAAKYLPLLSGTPTRSITEMLEEGKHDDGSTGSFHELGD